MQGQTDTFSFLFVSYQDTGYSKPYEVKMGSLMLGLEEEKNHVDDNCARLTLIIHQTHSSNLSRDLLRL